MPTDRRADFHDFAGVTYLNCAPQGPMPRVATAAVEAALDLKRAPYRIREVDYFLYPDRYRAAVAGTFEIGGDFGRQRQALRPQSLRRVMPTRQRPSADSRRGPAGPRGS